LEVENTTELAPAKDAAADSKPKTIPKPGPTKEDMQQSVRKFREQLPIKRGHDLTIVQVGLKQNYLMFIYELDPAPAKVLDEIKKNSKAWLINELKKDKDMIILSKAGYTLSYRVLSRKGHMVAQAHLRPYELR
jgi:hypothetical protein